MLSNQLLVSGSPAQEVLVEAPEQKMRGSLLMVPESIMKCGRTRPESACSLLIS
jgi:hypothetical protein